MEGALIGSGQRLWIYDSPVSHKYGMLKPALMRRYVDYLKTRADKGILSFGLGDWYDYGDFRAGFSRNTPVPLVATARCV